MRIWCRIVDRLKVCRVRRVADLDRELRTHLDLEVEEQQEAGMSSEEARYAAHRAFGNTTLVGGCTRNMGMDLVGVMPPGFFGDALRGDPADFWIPLAMEPNLDRDVSAWPLQYWPFPWPMQRSSPRAAPPRLIQSARCAPSSAAQ
jgi:hypothetical protein